MIDENILETMRLSKQKHPDCKTNETFLGYIPHQETGARIKLSENPIRFGFAVYCGCSDAVYPAFELNQE